MGANDTTPPQPDPQAVGEAAASAAADSGASREQAAAASRDAAAAVNVQLSDEQLDAIAERTIDKLDKRGAFEPEPPATPPADAGEPPAPSEPPPPVDDEPPRRKRTFAERFAGRP